MEDRTPNGHHIDGNQNNNEGAAEFPLGSVLLDLKEYDLAGIVNRAVDQMVIRDELPYEKRDAVVEILLQKYKQVKDQQNTLRNSTRKSNKPIAQGDAEEPFTRRASIRKSLTKVFHISAVNNFLNYNTLDESSPTKEIKLYPQIGVENENESQKTHTDTEAKHDYPQGTEATAVLLASVDFLAKTTVAFVRLSEVITMENSIDTALPVRFLFIALGHFHGDKDYHAMGSSIMKMVSDKSFYEAAHKAHSREELKAAIQKFLSLTVRRANGVVNGVTPHFPTQNSTGDLDATVVRTNPTRNISTVEGERNHPIKRDPLKREGKPFYGLIQDVKFRYSKYLSDIKDGLNLQVLSACIFIFFAALSPAITFGGMYADQTDRFIGVGETLLVSSINGMIFSLFAAQPIIIVGSTGPLMIFDISLLQFCRSMDLDFLSIRVWIGIWIFIIGLVFSAFEMIVVVKKLTRFTEEIFGTFVSIIFIYGSFEKLAEIFINHPLSSEESYFRGENNTNIFLHNGSLLNVTGEEGEVGDESHIKINQPNTALLSMCLMLGTFLTTWKLKKFRNSKFLSRRVRRTLGDFGVPIAIFLMVLIDFLIKDTYTDKLTMPKGLKPSNSAVRGWFINPFGVTKALPIWCMFAAAPAALLLFIFIFVAENICQLILSKPERCLKKGTGFHFDMQLSCFLNIISGFFGAPFMGPSCVRTISHMSALTITASMKPGHSPRIVGCHEQRLSGFVVSLLVGVGVMFYAVLNLVPNAVLYGIFLYMGVSATAGIQLLERTVLYLMPVKYHYPDEAYVQNVRTWRMHVFTAIQLAILSILWGVKQSPASLAVPFVLICLIPFRIYLLPLIFTSDELVALDGAKYQTAEEVAKEEADFYEYAHALPTQIQDEHTRQN